ncbi:MAG: MarR family transcriptional regulator [Verrucomicrobiota bacterium]
MDTIITTECVETGSRALATRVPSDAMLATRLMTRTGKKETPSAGAYALLALVIENENREEGALILREAVETLGISSAGVTTLCDSLELCGYAKRRHSADDRRVIYLEATKKGQRYLEEIRSEFFTAQKEAVA